MSLTQEELSTKFVYAKRQPQRSRDASQTDDQGMHIHAGVDGLQAVEGIAFVFIHDHDTGDVAYGS